MHTRYNSHRTQQEGFSLVELMVAITISMLLLVGLVTLMLNSNQTQNEISKAGMQLENGRYALQLLKNEIQHAGFYGRYNYPGKVSTAAQNPCTTDETLLAAGMPYYIFGYNNPSDGAAPIPGCTALTDANHLGGTDILVIRRADTNTVPLATPTAVTAADLVASEVYLQSNGGGMVLDLGDPDSFDDLTTFSSNDIAEIRKYRVDIYFISPCSIPDGGGNCSASSDNGNPIPTLKRLILTSQGGALNMVTEPLVEGIEDMQIEYGIDREIAATATAYDGSPNASAAGANDDYEYLPDDPTEWQDVVALRLNLLVRNHEPTRGYTDDKSYVMGNTENATSTRTFNGAAASYKRRLFSTVVRLINPSSRRET